MVTFLCDWKLFWSECGTLLSDLFIRNEVVVFYEFIQNAMRVNLYDSICDRLVDGMVVRTENQRAFKIAHAIIQSLNTLKVEVAGRFV